MVAEPQRSAKPSLSAAPPEQPPLIRPGTIAVRSSPWGAVFIDGVAVGNSPQVVRIAPGRHTVSVRTEAGETKSQIVTVKSGVTHTVQLVF